ncbi:Biotin-protein ligase [Coccomyxa sp. Obi]|nr:Biotin-protein ligase [Coccomyxa sp. Obi]
MSAEPGTYSLDVYTRTTDILEQAKPITEKGPLVTAKGIETGCEVLVNFAEHDRPSTLFKPDTFFQHLTTRSQGSVLATASALPSTQTLLQDNPGHFPHGTVCVADRQIKGKGRGQNTWESPEGCLMFSTSVHLSIQGQSLPFVQYVVSLAIVQAVQEEAKKRLKDNVVDVRIKWPNDIYGQKLKLGGILCQSAYRNQQFHVVIGIGLNLSNRQPTTCIDALIEQKHRELNLEGSAQPVKREVLLAGILNRLEELLDVLLSSGFEPLQKPYLDAWLHTSQKVILEENQGGNMQQVPLTIQGLTSNGYLKAHDELGEQYELHPDGNSLDFFKGLMRKKA